jgi:hypothetical protein
VPAAGSLQTSRAFAIAYDASDPRLVNAILDALAALKVPFDRRVEVTPDWALVWADVRIKVRRDAPGQSVVEVSAPPASFTPQAFGKRIEALLSRAELALLRYRSTSEKLGLDAPGSDP